MFDIYRIALAAPELHPADVKFNTDKIIAAYRDAAAAGASLVLFPELAVTGKSCGILFKQPYLLKNAATAAQEIAGITGNAPAVFGVPQLVNGSVLNTLVWAQHGKIAFSIAKDPAAKDNENNIYPPGTLLDCGIPVSLEFYGNFPQNNGAVLKLFAGAEPRLPGNDRRHREFFSAISRAGKCAAAGVFAGAGESGTDTIFGGAPCFAVNGENIAAGNTGITFFDFDAEKLIASRLTQAPVLPELKTAPVPQAPDMKYLHNPAHPFLPEDPSRRADFCRETLEIQSQALGLRFRRSYAKSFVIGISGGLDSTLALAVLAKCCNDFDLPPQNIIAVTMPGFGTTGRTRNNALRLAEIIGATIREIPIAPACSRHFSDIGHDPDIRNSVYENTQARERTQILMDIANQTGGIVVGTGDLSEIALGWCTFNGDHMAMYNVNSSIPKSSIAPILEYAAAFLPAGAAEILQDVIDTPVSPELLPPDENGAIGQKTEEILGAYELHDYFLWHLACGVSDPEKLLVLAQHAFKEKYPAEEIIRVREIFFRRFFTQQFKRTAAPDGIQAGAISLSARTAWQMGADISGALWRS